MWQYTIVITTVFKIEAQTAEQAQTLGREWVANNCPVTDPLAVNVLVLPVNKRAKGKK